MARNYYDENVPVKDMAFDDFDTLDVAGAKFNMLPSAQRLLANRLQIPFSYLERCSPTLQAQNLNYWLEFEKKNRDTFFCRFDGSRLRAIFTERYKPLDNTAVLDKMSAYGLPDDTEVHLTLNQNMMVAKVPDYERLFAINQDQMTPGIAVSNSEVGVLSFSIEAYFYRLACTNGLITKTEVCSKFRHISLKALDSFNQIMRQVIEESRSKEGQLKISMERPVDEPANTIASFNRRFQLTRKESEAVLEAWALEPGHTMFNVINAYTRAAQFEILSSEESNRLERTGGSILNLMR